MRRITALLVLLLVLLLGAHALDGVGLNPIRPYQLNKGQKTKYLFSIQTQEQITTKAKISVKFPAEFDQSAVAANLACMARSDSYAWKTVPCRYTKGAVVLTLGEIQDEQMQVLIASPKNPTLYTMSSYFEVCLMYDDFPSTCNK